MTIDVWSSHFLFNLDFFTPIGLWDKVPPVTSSLSSKFRENEDKPGDACAAESGVGFSDSEDVYPIPHGFLTCLAWVS